MKLIEDRFEELHNSIVEGSANLSKEQANMLEKEMIMSIVDKIISDKSGIEEDELLIEFKRQILIIIDNLWAQKEPDRVVTLLAKNT